MGSCCSKSADTSLQVSLTDIPQQTSNNSSPVGKGANEAEQAQKARQPTPPPSPKQDAPKQEVPKQDVPKQDVPKQDVPKQEEKPLVPVDNGPTPRGVNDKDGDAFKLILCGSGESGKTTYLRQLRLKYLDGFGENEKSDFISTIRGNLVETIQQLIIWLERNSLTVKEDAEEALNSVGDIDAFSCDYDEELCANLKTLWEDQEIQNAFQHRDETPIPDHMDYFFNKIDSLFSEDYKPTQEDVLKARIRSIGVSDVTLNMDDALIRIYDVGGQKNERSKWERVMNDVDGVIFCVSFSDFDKPMFEDKAILRIVDSIQIFEAITHRDSFRESPFFLVCNKFDMFERKVKNTDAFGKTFQQYYGDIHDVNQCAQYIVDLFLEKAGNIETRPIKVFNLVALDQNSSSDITNKICKFISENYFS